MTTPNATSPPPTHCRTAANGYQDGEQTEQWMEDLRRMCVSSLGAFCYYFAFLLYNYYYNLLTYTGIYDWANDNGHDNSQDHTNRRVTRIVQKAMRRR